MTYNFGLDAINNLTIQLGDTNNYVDRFKTSLVGKRKENLHLLFVQIIISSSKICLFKKRYTMKEYIADVSMVSAILDTTKTLKTKKVFLFEFFL